MAKEELLEFDGTVTEVLPDGNYRVKLDNDHELLAYISGKMRKFRINFRHKERAAGPAPAQPGTFRRR